MEKMALVRKASAFGMASVIQIQSILTMMKGDLFWEARD